MPREVSPNMGKLLSLNDRQKGTGLTA